ncbi:MAG: GIY-YIG nuclease family protein [Sulfitobacter sp.]
MKPGYAELEFDLPGALLRAIVEMFDNMAPADLTANNLKRVEEEPGVYALYSKSTGDLLYIGKAESKKGLHNRLTRHMRKIGGRHHIMPSDVRFKSIRVFVFAALDLEATLIAFYGGTKKVPWNHSGFGSNDPGKERDTTKYKIDHFDTAHPIRLDTIFVPITPGIYTVAEVMQRLKDGLPFLLRFERPNPNSKKSFAPDFLTSSVTVPAAGMTTRQMVDLCVKSLPTGWQATAFPSHIICYKNDNRKFPSGTLIAKS